MDHTFGAGASHTHTTAGVTDTSFEHRDRDRDTDRDRDRDFMHLFQSPEKFVNGSIIGKATINTESNNNINNTINTNGNDYNGSFGSFGSFNNTSASGILPLPLNINSIHYSNYGIQQQHQQQQPLSAPSLQQRHSTSQIMNYSASPFKNSTASNVNLQSSPSVWLSNTSVNGKPNVNGNIEMSETPIKTPMSLSKSLSHQTSFDEGISRSSRFFPSPTIIEQNYHQPQNQHQQLPQINSQFVQSSPLSSNRRITIDDPTDLRANSSMNLNLNNFNLFNVSTPGPTFDTSNYFEPQKNSHGQQTFPSLFNETLLNSQFQHNKTDLNISDGPPRSSFVDIDIEMNHGRINTSTNFLSPSPSPSSSPSPTSKQKSSISFLNKLNIEDIEEEIEDTHAIFTSSPIRGAPQNTIFDFSPPLSKLETKSKQRASSISSVASMTSDSSFSLIKSPTLPTAEFLPSQKLEHDISNTDNIDAKSRVLHFIHNIITRHNLLFKSFIVSVSNSTSYDKTVILIEKIFYYIGKVLTVEDISVNSASDFKKIRVILSITDSGITSSSINLASESVSVPWKTVKYNDNNKEFKMILFLEGDVSNNKLQDLLLKNENVMAYLNNSEISMHKTLTTNNKLDVCWYPEGFSSTFHRRGVNNFMFVRELQSKMIINRTRNANGIVEMGEFRVSMPIEEMGIQSECEEKGNRLKRSFLVNIDLKELEGKSNNNTNYVASLVNNNKESRATINDDNRGNDETNNRGKFNKKRGGRGGGYFRGRGRGRGKKE